MEKRFILFLFCLFSLTAFSQSIQADYYALIGQSTATYDADAQAYFNNLVTYGSYTATANEKNYVNTYITSLKAAGIWTKIYDEGLCLGPTAASQSVMLKAANVIVGSWTGSFTYNFNGFVSDGTTAYFNTWINPAAKLTLNNTHMALYSRTSAAGSSSSYDMGVLNSSSQELSLIIRRSNNSNFSMAYNESAGMLTSTSATDGSGLFISNRPSATEHELYRNGTILLSQTTSGGSLPSGLNLVIGGLNANGSVGFFTSRQYCFWSVGQGFTPTEAQNFTTIVNTLQTSLNRNIF